MEFEWDSEKAETNEAKHGVSFHSAADLDWASALFVPQVVRGERRIGAFAPIGDRLHFCAYVLRGGALPHYQPAQGQRPRNSPLFGGPEMKAKIHIPSPEEDAEITAAAIADPDAQPVTDAEFDLALKMERAQRDLDGVIKAIEGSDLREARKLALQARANLN